MKRLLIFITALFSVELSYAGLITHTDYTSGNVITAAGQNSNENTVFNEFNGNIESANIKDGTIVSADIAAGGVGISNLTTTMQSTFTYVQTLGSYRRPNLIWISATAVDVEANTGSANQTCIQFPDSQRCVVENTGSTTVNRRFKTTTTASFSGTKSGGMASPEVFAAGTDVTLYAVKVQDNSTDFVIAGSSNTPTQANATAINTIFGSGSWVYLGMIVAGDRKDRSGVLQFQQNGHFTILISTFIGTQTGKAIAGVQIGTAGSATSLTYTATVDNGNVANNHISSSWTHVVFTACAINLTATVAAKNQSMNTELGNIYAAGGCLRFLTSQAEGLSLIRGGSDTPSFEIGLSGWYDGVLGVGFNPAF